jgi:hypothetical protein
VRSLERTLSTNQTERVVRRRRGEFTSSGLALLAKTRRLVR